MTFGFTVDKFQKRTRALPALILIYGIKTIFLTERVIPFRIVRATRCRARYTPLTFQLRVSFNLLLLFLYPPERYNSPALFSSAPLDTLYFPGINKYLFILFDITPRRACGIRPLPPGCIVSDAYLLNATERK